MTVAEPCIPPTVPVDASPSAAVGTHLQQLQQQQKQPRPTKPFDSLVAVPTFDKEAARVGQLSRQSLAAGEKKRTLVTAVETHCMWPCCACCRCDNGTVTEYAIMPCAGFAIGISTLYRGQDKQATYLIATLQSLLDHSLPEERRDSVLVILLADVTHSNRQKVGWHMCVCVFHTPSIGSF